MSTTHQKDIENFLFQFHALVEKIYLRPRGLKFAFKLVLRLKHADSLQRLATEANTLPTDSTNFRGISFFPGFLAPHFLVRSLAKRGLLYLDAILVFG